ncbi:MAG: DUF4178 domain-containing protein [Deltaproteobacteria bacterium]|nr:MAG: DUF4178 domain-containing protein [Deltaproteobacteria bacterium]
MAGAKKIACTQCGAPLEIQNPRAKTVVCAHCGAQLDLTSPDYAFLGVVQREPLLTPLKVGQSGTDTEGVTWTIIGMMRLREDSWYWDEFLIQATDGRTAWIQYDDGEFSIFAPKRLTEPLDPKEIQGKFFLEGRWHYVRERGQAVIDRIEGELTWKAKVGDVMNWIDAAAVGIEWTDREIEVFERRHIERSALATMFGMSVEELSEGAYTLEDDDEDEGWAPVSSSGKQVSAVQAAVIIGFLLLFLLFLAYAASQGGSMVSSSSGGYSRGYSSGGGFSFGKN